MGNIMYVILAVIVTITLTTFTMFVVRRINEERIYNSVSKEEYEDECNRLGVDPYNGGSLNSLIYDNLRVRKIQEYLNGPAHANSNARGTRDGDA